MEFRPGALSKDGYIIDQRKTDNISFGRVTSDKNGCGWIAVYNFLKAMEQTPEPDRLVRELERTLLFGGYLGLHLGALLWRLRSKKLEFALRPFHAQCISERCRAGIVLYFTGRRNHFVAFRREENGKLRFFGAVPGKEYHETSMAEFYWDHVKFPVAVTITAK